VISISFVSVTCRSSFFVLQCQNEEKGRLLIIRLQRQKKGCSYNANKTTTDAAKEKNKTNNDEDIIESRLSVPLENDDEVENISCDTTVSEEKKTKHNY